jgi:cytidylate kinase
VPLLIAIDGPAGAGKSTVGLQLARRLGATFVDTGLFYRVVTLIALEHGVDFDDSTALAAIARELEIRLVPPGADGQPGAVHVGGRALGPELRSSEVDAHVSEVAGHGPVRAALIEPQRRAVTGGRAVVVGRDIGTVICPDADVKVYLEATPDERARRRALQLDSALPFDEVRASVDRRDKLDRTRSVAPLETAPDAVVIETDGVPVDEVVERIYRLAQRRETAHG